MEANPFTLRAFPPVSFTMSRGRGNLTLSPPLPAFSSPADTSPIFCVAKHPVILRDTAGRRIILSCVTCLFFSPYCWATPRNVTEHDKGGVSYFCSTIVFNPLALRALPLYSLTETQGERIERGILCFGIRIVLCISLLLLHDTP